ncbi:Retrovirus-related Pol polyprotein from transposon TNT 1-94 [Dendrobium catenatum]|uniref:Retrovirus-related Pol polyprotein from transposon TNT 1-94 n=1 Tax=Dendrobium catenatum TaxID=906689 RepID=A0A2I0XAK1_9ASPA|nr:Retrovirus-related Pol polyprotein from transposon TNT 1-94 [Dendrobium catenatum]
MLNKSETFSKFYEFNNMINRQFDTNIKIVRSDGGGEFINSQFNYLFKRLGILHQYTCPYTPSQNGTAERKHRHLLETTRSLLIEAKLPQSLWTEALTTAAYLINRLPTKSLHNHSPYHILYHQPAKYNHLKIFGCLCYPWLRPYHTTKLSPLSTPCILTGYASAQKGYKCLDPQTGRTYISRHVIFNENIFPYSQLTMQDSSQTQLPNIPPLLMVPISSSNVNVPIPSTKQTPPPDVPSRITPIAPTPNTDSVNQPTQLATTTTASTGHPMVTRSKSGIIKSKHIFNLLHTHTKPDPTSYTEAARHEHWRTAMSQEFQALQSQGTWDLVPPDPQQNVLGCKWTFRTKYRADGSIARYKARLVAKGFDQEYGIDYQETFSPVAKIPTIRILLILALQHAWPIHQLDVSNAFLHGQLHHTVYMTQPPGFVDNLQPNYVCQLKKALYRLKQSPREWFSTLSGYLHTLGFQFSTSDSSLLIYNKNGTRMYFLVYVDDILLTGNCQQAIKQLLQTLNSRFTMKDLGQLSQFLGIQVTHTPSGLHLSQGHFAQTILHRAGMLNCKPVSTPSQIKNNSTNQASLAFANPSLYRQLAGSLQYLTLTRPDISFAVNKVCQHMQNPTNLHFESLKRLLRYIHGTLHVGLPLSGGDLTLRSYADADWAGDTSDRKSITGYCNFLGHSLISWSVKKQNAVARSSTEAEYRALAAAAAEVTWIRRLLHELDCPQHSPTPLYCDNTSAIALANNPVFHARTKHIDVDCHYIRNCIKENSIQVHHISTKDQIADLFTKPLHQSRFKLLSNKLINPPDSSI